MIGVLGKVRKTAIDLQDRRVSQTPGESSSGFLLYTFCCCLSPLSFGSNGPPCLTTTAITLPRSCGELLFIRLLQAAMVANFPSKPHKPFYETYKNTVGSCQGRRGQPLDPVHVGFNCFVSIHHNFWKAKGGHGQIVIHLSVSLLSFPILVIHSNA